MQNRSFPILENKYSLGNIGSKYSYLFSVDTKLKYLTDSLNNFLFFSRYNEAFSDRAKEKISESKLENLVEDERRVYLPV